MRRKVLPLSLKRLSEMFTVKEYRDLYSLELDELFVEDLKDEDILQLVAMEDEEGPMYQVQKVVKVDCSPDVDDMPFDLVQGQDVVEV